MKTFTFLIAIMILSATNIFAQNAPPIEAGVSQKLAQWRGKHYSDVRYKLNITLEKGAPLMKGEIEISVKLTDEGAKNDLILDWRTTQFQNDKDKPFANVIAVNSQLVKDTVPNGVFDYQINKEHLIISQKYLKTGENVITIKFASPIKTSGAAITRYVDKEDNAEYVYSLFVPSDASTAFPVFDQPDLKARFQLSVGAPEDWDVISNTSPFTTDNIGATIFPETKPISTYLFAFAAGNFDVFVDGYSDSYRQFQKKNPSNEEFLKFLNSKKSRIYVRQSQAEKFKQHSAEVFRLNREGVKYLESYFDYKFPFPKYDLVLLPEFPFGGMEHAGATFLRESSIIFPNEPTKNDYVSRANLIFHEAAHQWFGDTVTMKWFDDLWLKEGFAEFMAYKTLAQVMPEYNAWKIFYERNKQLAYLTDSTRGTTPIYQEIANLSSAKSAYGNIVYRKAPSFLKQAEFYLGEKEFQTAVRAFLKKHEFANATWQDLVKEFEVVSGNDQMRTFAGDWINHRGMPKFTYAYYSVNTTFIFLEQSNALGEEASWWTVFNVLTLTKDEKTGNYIKSVETIGTIPKRTPRGLVVWHADDRKKGIKEPDFVFPNYQDYGYGIFLLDEKSRAYVLENIQSEKDDFLRTMMWGALWDSVREGELAPKDYVELVIKVLSPDFSRQNADNKSSKTNEKPAKAGTPNEGETDESAIQILLSRVSTAMNYYLNDKQREEFVPKLETLLIEKMQKSETLGQRITFYRAFLNLASSENARTVLKEMFKGGSLRVSKGGNSANSNDSALTNVRASAPIPLKTKDKFDIVTKLVILGDKDALSLLAELEKTETSDEAKRYAYAARAGIGSAENKLKFWNDFVANKDISESWIESAFVSFNSPRHSDLTLPYLEKALAELPNLKRNRKIFFVNGWLASFIGGQRSEEALKIVNKFLADNPNLDKDLRLKILENVDLIERAVKIRKRSESKL